MTNKLKTLEEHNKLFQEYYNPKMLKNGIACPECGEELVDSNPLETLMSFPPQKSIHCIKDGCGYKGYRLA
jgi:hypothetical protein